jgi:hypothetical protein
LSTTNEQIDELESGMDGYEKFLYDNPMWYQEHNSASESGSAASIYDKGNLNSLINNLPEFLVQDYEQNQDYIKFVGMVGHFFDNIALTIKQYTEKNNHAISNNGGTTMEIIGDMLRSLGWETEISRDNLPLLLSSFSKTDFDQDSSLYAKSGEMSEDQRNKLIWKRILDTLPFIYKTKGTEASLNALLSCFGVPKNIIKVKEYGGMQNTHDLTDDSLFIFDEIKYEPYFSGSGEYLSLNWTGSAKSIEFNVSFDPIKTHAEGKVFRLVNCPDFWVIGAYRDKGLDWGRMFFSIDGGETKTVLTGKVPIFDGNSYRVLLKKENVDQSLNATSSLGLYPTLYSLHVQKSEEDRIVFRTSGSILLSGSYNETFSSGSQLMLGNYGQNTASLGIDPEAFFGNIDDILVWETQVPLARFDSHTLHRGSYDLDDPQEMISSCLYRVSFDRPLNLRTTSSLRNLAFRQDYQTFSASNFPTKYYPEARTSECDTGFSESFD